MIWNESQEKINQLSTRLETIEDRNLQLSYLPPEFLTHWAQQLNDIKTSKEASGKYDSKINYISQKLNHLEEQAKEIAKLKSSLDDKAKEVATHTSNESVFLYLKIRVDLQTAIAKQCYFINQVISAAKSIADDHARADKHLKPADSATRKDQLDKYLQRLEAVLTQLNEVAQPDKLNNVDITFSVAGQQQSNVQKPKTLTSQLNALPEIYSHEFRNTNSAGFFGSAKLMVKSMLQATKTREEQMQFLLSLNALDHCEDDHRIAAIDFVLTAISQERHGAHSTLATVLRNIKGNTQSFMTADDLRAFVSANHIELPESMGVQIKAVKP